MVEAKGGEVVEPGPRLLEERDEVLLGLPVLAEEPLEDTNPDVHLLEPLRVEPDRLAVAAHILEVGVDGSRT